MLYTVASQGWAPGSPLPASETRAGLYRTRREAEAIAAGRRLLAVSVHYDATRGLLTPTPSAGRELPRGWLAPAIEGASGGLTCLASIPSSLVRLVGPARLKVHAGHRHPVRPAPRGRVVPVPTK